MRFLSLDTLEDNHVASGVKDSFVTATEKRRGLLFTLVGPGGAGKNALINGVLHRVDNLRQLPTATTRPIRPHEQPGREHQFVTLEEFQRLIRSGELIEWTEVHPNRYYGTPRATVERAIANGEDLIADIDVKGATKIDAEYPENTVAIFIAPPSMEELEMRMRARGESEEEIAKRLQRANMEMTYRDQYDHVIINSRLEQAIRELESIIEDERGRHAERIRLTE
jgi:guanylate kinase